MKILGCIVFVLAIAGVSFAASLPVCKDLPDHAAVTAALKKAVAVGDAKANGGLALNIWATVVARDGTVCAVTYTGAD